MSLPVNPLVTRSVALPFANVQDAVNNILKIDTQNVSPKMWYFHDNDKEYNRFIISCVGTGHVVPYLFTKENYMGTLQVDEYVFHYFILMDDEVRTRQDLELTAEEMEELAR